MLELCSNEFTIVLPMLSKIKNKAVFALSVIEQTQKGKIFVNRILDPSAALITSCGGFYCVVGNASYHTFNDAIANFLNDKENHIGFYALAMFTEEWERALQKYQLIHANKIKRTYFRLNDQKFTEMSIDISLKIDDGLHYEALNEHISNQYREDFYTYYKLVWDSNEHFNVRGIGHFITKDNQIISVCSSPYVGGGFAEIDIITVEEYTRKGLATKVAALFINDCRSKNLIPNWSCHSDNQASLSLASKLGFEPIAEHPMYWYNV
ncbi:GNAT family N-acetyltransferase [Paenibacillus sinopodophylli]|uniref:GNAT family N-acetyltransferase n=1 Tax=Paenibacillus sinopodophylli TaxID=1837342 RepID=UPI00110CC80C|nr:GNAT family N-acetyltransferase [Paenibacillus sinopodophylli]